MIGISGFDVSMRRALAFLGKEEKKNQNSLGHFSTTFGPHVHRLDYLRTHRAGSHRFGRNNGVWYRKFLRPHVIIIEA